MGAGLPQNSLIDISLPLDERLVVYPGDQRPVVKRLASIAEGDALTASELTIGCHVGTHVDAPAHFLSNGAAVTDLPLAHFHGPARVLNLTELEIVDEAAVRAARPPSGVHLLLKTRNSALLSESVFRRDYCSLTVAAAEALLEQRPLSIGFDYYSLDRPGDEEFPVHRTAAERGLPVFVCLDLRGVEAGDYHFSALPLRVAGLEGVPVRAVLTLLERHRQVG